MASLKGGKNIAVDLGPCLRYYQTSNILGEIIGETTDTDIYLYHRSIGKNKHEALKRVDYVMTKHGARVLIRPRK